MQMYENILELPYLSSPKYIKVNLILVITHLSLRTLHITE